MRRPWPTGGLLRKKKKQEKRKKENVMLICSFGKRFSSLRNTLRNYRIRGLKIFMLVVFTAICFVKIICSLLHPAKGFKFQLHVLATSVTIRVQVASVVNLRQKELMMFLITDKRFDTTLMNDNQMCFVRGI